MAYSTPGLLTDESRWLAKLVRMQRMAIHSTLQEYYPFSLTFTIGDGGGSTPLNGTDTYTNAALTGAIKVYKDGALLTQGTDYTHASGSFVLIAPREFETGDVYIVLY